MLFFDLRSKKFKSKVNRHLLGFLLVGGLAENAPVPPRDPWQENLSFILGLFLIDFPICFPSMSSSFSCN